MCVCVCVVCLFAKIIRLSLTTTRNFAYFSLKIELWAFRVSFVRTQITNGVNMMAILMERCKQHDSIDYLSRSSVQMCQRIIILLILWQKQTWL